MGKARGDHIRAQAWVCVALAWAGVRRGGVLGSLAQGRWGWSALALPLLGLAGVIAAALLRPFDAASALEAMAGQR